MTRNVKMWARNAQGSLKLAWGADESKVSEAAWKCFNRKFFKWYRRENWYPLEPMDAYQRGCEAMIKAANRMATGGTVLRGAGADTYVIGAGLRQLRDFETHSVRPTRSMYRALSECGSVPCDGEDEARGEECSLDVQAYVESLPADDGWLRRQEGRRFAQECLLATLPRIAAEASRGFHCWLAAGGNYRRAAKLMSLPCSTYFLRFEEWCRQFKEVGGWN